MFFKKKSTFDKLKANSLKCYLSSSAVGNNYKYRSVFDKSELDSFTTEFSFYNKLFDEDNWSAKVKLECYIQTSNDNRKLYFTHHEEISVDQKLNIFKLKHSPLIDSSDWEIGKYEWEAYVDEDLISSTSIFIDSVGFVSTSYNPYFDVAYLKTYESSENNVPKDDRVYLKEFNYKTARFIVGELNIRTKLRREWHCELFFNVYDDTGLLIGSNRSHTLISPNDEDIDQSFTITSGGGREKPGLWIKDNFHGVIILYP